MSPSFQYRARSRDGGTVEGSVEADSREEVARNLRDQELYVTNIEKVEESSSIFTRDINFSSINLWGGGFSIADLAHFSKQFSVLIAAGVPLVQSLEIMEDQTEEERVEDMLAELRSSVEAGSSFSDALDEHPEFFPPLYVHLVRAGETGGVLDEVLEELSDYYKRRDKINKEVKSALYYPAAMVIVAIIVVLILLTFVLPTITEMLVDLGGDLPLPTVIMITVSDFLQNYWWAVFGGVLLLGLGLRYFTKTERGDAWKDRILLKIPVVGNLLRKVIISRFANTLGLLLESGVNIINALPVLENVVGNVVYRNALREARARVREGENLSTPLEKSGCFPPIVIQMIQVGEETGNLDDMLDRLSQYYDVEVENAIEGGISLIEPTIIVFMAVIVGGIVASVLLPLFDVYQQF